MPDATPQRLGATARLERFLSADRSGRQRRRRHARVLTASQAALFWSVLRPGTFFMWTALTTSSSKPAATKT